MALTLCGSPHAMQDEMLFQEGLNSQKDRARKIFKRIDKDRTGEWR